MLGRITYTAAAKTQKAEAPPITSRNQATSSFGAVFVRASNSNAHSDNAVPTASRGEQRREIQNRRSSVQSQPQQSQSNEQRELSNGNQEIATQGNAAASEGANTAVQEETQATEKDNERLLQELAAIFQVPLEIITQILVSLDINLEDLANPEIKLQFMTEVLGVDESALLTMDNALTMTEQLSQTIENHQNTISFKEVAQAIQSNENEEEAMPILKSEIFGETLEIENAETPQIASVRTPRTTTAATVAEVDINTETQIGIDATAIAEEADIEPEIFAATKQTAQVMQQTNTENQDTPEFLYLQPNQTMTQTLSNAQATATPQPAAPVSPQNVIEQIVKGMRMEVLGNSTEIRIMLKPENLGEISLRIATQNGIVTAQFIADNQRIKEIIESGFNQLRESLNAQGINVAQIEVGVSDSSENSNKHFEFGKDISETRVQNLMDMAIAEELANELAGLTQNDFESDGTLRQSTVNLKA
ncbi:MAG: flagellar hook-length control protein FliK [Defluviitaleaceae bacterium]|nr:flagellar hook-length control protein FliK [Defluviitaleaceae bacterium]